MPRPPPRSPLFPYTTLFRSWGPAVTGREQKALQVFNEAVAYYGRLQQAGTISGFEPFLLQPHGGDLGGLDRKSTRLNSSHQIISYAVFCLKKKNKHKIQKNI